MPTNDEDLLQRKKRWNYKKIGLITGAVLVAVIAITVIVVVLTGGEDEDITTDTTITTSSQTSQTPTIQTPTILPTDTSLPPFTTAPPNKITLSDILNNNLATKRFTSKWISGSNILVNDDKGLQLVDVLTQSTRVLLAPRDNELLLKAYTHSLSPDNTHLIIGYDEVKGYRHSYEASYIVLELIASGSTSKAGGEVIQIFINDPTDKLTLVQWSPTGQGLVIVYKNNIYYKKDLFTTPKQITTNGGPKIFNGIPDWVYEEEVFGSNSAIRFSPDGNKLAYIQFDDTNVETYEYTYYGKPGSEDAQYPTKMEVSYPKVGTTNPTVKLYRVDLLSSSSIEEINVPVPLSNVDHIITTLSWANNETMIATWMNRVQNEAYIQVCNSLTCLESNHFTSTDGWVELFTNPLYNIDGSQFALIISQDQGGDAGGYRHLTLFSTVDDYQIVLTKGKYVVTQLLYWDTVLNYIFYLANTENDSRVLHVYAIKPERDALAQCLTCDLGSLWDDYKYFSASFSKDEQLFALNALGPAIPRADIYSYNEVNNTINIVHERVWEVNEALQQKLADLDTPFPTVEYNDEIILNSHFKAQVSMILPGDINPSGAKKYPVLINVYGGPDSHSVTFQWGTNWGTYLAAAKNIIYVRIDGRGSGLRGDKLLNEIYRKLGTVEIEDQIKTAKALADKYHFIDRNHIGIWGWSYGGYAAGLALAKDTEDIFKCAASVAPVTDWTYYDTIYTERYMGLLNDNIGGYNISRLSTLYKEFDGKNYFLIHGTLDDNVHYQQAMALSRTLERHAVLFKQMSYPDEDHSLSNVQEHLYSTLERFFSDCFHLE